MNIAYIPIMSDKSKVKKTSCMQSTHSFGIRVSKHNQRKSFPIPLFYLFTLLQSNLLYVVTSPNYQLYRHINCYLVTLIPSTFPAIVYTYKRHVPNTKTIISINLKSTFTKTNNHVIIHSQLIVISHNATTIAYYTQVHINGINTYVLVQSSQNKIIGTYTHIMKFIKHSTNLKTHYVK